MLRRAFALTLALSAAAGLAGSALAPATAEASVSLLVSLEELVRGSAFVVVGTPTEHRSEWAELPSGRRIVTYTKVTVDKSLAGAPPKELWVRTLGGVVGKIGQTVSGEAKLKKGEKAVLFLAKAGSDHVVASMAQGHYPVEKDAKGVLRLRASPDAGLLLPQPGPVLTAREQLVGLGLEPAEALVKKVRAAVDAKAKR